VLTLQEERDIAVDMKLAGLKQPGVQSGRKPLTGPSIHRQDQ
jgi:hypothetical protein